MASRMSRRLTGGLTFANVCSFLALIVALGTGGAYAAGTVGSHEIKNKSIRSVDIKDGQVKAADVHSDAIDSSKVAADSLTGPDLAAGAVGSAELAVGAVNGAKVADDSIGLADLVGVDVTGTVSLNGIADGRCTQVNLLINGAEVGQTAIVSTGAALQNGIVLYAQRVSAPNIVELDACNFSGGAMTAIASFPIRAVTFG